MYSKIVAATLPRFLQPTPVHRQGCASCDTFAAEVMVPAGLEDEGVAMMCWMCAHYVTEHGTPIDSAFAERCDCKREDIYPADVLEQMNVARAHGSRTSLPS